MFQFNTRGNTLHFDFPEGQIDFNEVLQAVGQAARISLREAQPVRVTIKGMDEIGLIETRHTPGRIYPNIVTNPTKIWYIPETHGYDLYVSSSASPLYRLCIPGVMDSIDQNVLAVSPDVVTPVHQTSMLRLVYNLTIDALEIVNNRVEMVPDWRIFPEDYNNIRAYRDMLAKKPRVAKPVDFGPILIKLFGEKIAAAILKEIK